MAVCLLAEGDVQVIATSRLVLHHVTNSVRCKYFVITIFDHIFLHRRDAVIGSLLVLKPCKVFFNVLCHIPLNNFTLYKISGI